MDNIVNFIQPTDEITFYVIPEYAWGNLTVDDITDEINSLQNLLNEKHLVIFGSTIRIYL